MYRERVAKRLLEDQVRGQWAEAERRVTANYGWERHTTP